MNALQYIEHFKTTPEWAQMVATVEASPWHREQNVAVHTEMVIAQYVERFMPLRTEREATIGLIASLFHDVGKPEAEEVVTTNAERGVYRRYAGHEQNSAVAFTEYWLKDEKLQELLPAHDARTVRWMIEHHLPYGLKDTQKVGALKAATEATFWGLPAGEENFYDCLRSDAAGRISDDHETKLQNVEHWINGLKNVVAKPVESKKPHGSASPGVAYILIGPSGSGKSTWVKGEFRACDKLVSMDQYRLEYLAHVAGVSVKYTPEFYNEAWKLATDDGRLFDDYMKTQIEQTFHTLRLTGGDAYVDNTNTSKKSRARWVQEARNAGMRVTAVEFWNPLEVVLARQATRTDKTVPPQAVKSQYFAQTCAWLGYEVDDVVVVANGEDRAGAEA
jgi:predicted kinase